MGFGVGFGVVLEAYGGWAFERPLGCAGDGAGSMPVWWCGVVGSVLFEELGVDGLLLVEVFFRTWRVGLLWVGLLHPFVAVRTLLLLISYSEDGLGFLHMWVFGDVYFRDGFYYVCVIRVVGRHDAAREKRVYGRKE